jgi:hypothetical protein
VAFNRHVTLTAATVSTFTLATADNSSGFEILNRNGLGEVYISHDGTAAPANPTVAGNDFDVIPAIAGAAVQIRRIGTGTAVVKVISAQATAISIRAIQ